MEMSKTASFVCSFTLVPPHFATPANETSSPHSYDQTIETF
jgi:hypothetical protein